MTDKENLTNEQQIDLILYGKTYVLTTQNKDGTIKRERLDIKKVMDTVLDTNQTYYEVREDD